VTWLGQGLGAIVQCAIIARGISRNYTAAVAPGIHRIRIREIPVAAADRANGV
jgi:hypothetical protein